MTCARETTKRTTLLLLLLAWSALLAACAGVPAGRIPKGGSPPRAPAEEESPRAGREAAGPERNLPASAAAAERERREKPGPAAEPASKPAPAPASICLAGDVLLDRGIRTRIGRGVDLLAAVEPVLRESDVFFFNLESAVGTAGTKVVKEFNFLGDPAFLSLLAKARKTAAGLGNNHVMDYGREGLEQTLAALDERGILHAGAGKDLKEASAPAFFQVRGRKFAFLSFGVAHPEACYACEKKGGVAGLDTDLILSRLAEAKEASAFAVVSLHWGREYEDRAAAWQGDLARLLVDNGADCVFGHHPHVPQGIEVYKGKPIFYSLGNFLFDQWEEVKTRYRLLVKLDVSETAVRAALAPLLSNYTDFVPEAPDGKTFSAMAEHLRAISPDPAVIDPSKAYEKHGLRWIPLPCGEKVSR